MRTALFEASLQNAEFVLRTDLDTFIPVQTGLFFQKKNRKDDLYDSFKSISAGIIPSQDEQS